MINGKKIAVVMPAYNAASTLEKTVKEVDQTLVDDIILVDDVSSDDTIKIAQQLNLHVVKHDFNRGYGGNQKTCYNTALQRGADVVVMLHPDYQYTPLLLVSIASMVAYDVYDFVVASRIIGPGALLGGMPKWKYFANRVLTLVQNEMVGYKLSEYHTGFRAFSRDVLTSLRLEENSDDFVFDNQMIVQALAAGFRIGELSCPTRYEPDSSSINFRRSVKYGFGVLKTSFEYMLFRKGLIDRSYLRRIDD
ncbi:MAG: glycosyltransferase family 2 protein [Acidimicrobiales bacterium]|nr:glycosyltransferase family 2 protein [Acidimicrobiales bacterium]